jgi:hypothetical protein
MLQPNCYRPFFKCFLLAKWGYNVTGLARPQSAKPQALAGCASDVSVKIYKALQELNWLAFKGEKYKQSDSCYISILHSFLKH